MYCENVWSVYYAKLNCTSIYKTDKLKALL